MSISTLKGTSIDNEMSVSTAISHSMTFAKFREKYTVARMQTGNIKALAAFIGVIQGSACQAVRSKV